MRDRRDLSLNLDLQGKIKEMTLEEIETFDQMCKAFGLSELERDEIRAFGDSEIPLTKSGDWKEALFLENIEIDG